MSCARGCCPSQAEHYRSLLLVTPDPAHRRWDGQVDSYRKAREAGGQPPDTKSGAEFLRVVGG